jgi:ribonucleoside-triphosphate reductase (thioredoxin)
MWGRIQCSTTSHVEKLPEIHKATNEKRFLIGDSIEGWADAVRAIMKAYLGKSKTMPIFDFETLDQKEQN